MRVIQKAGTKGSLKWLQYLINYRPDLIDSKLREAGIVPGGATVEWLSPVLTEKNAEYRDATFLEKLGLGHLRNDLAKFWPTRGPQWDALGRAGNSVYLIEAKAHIPEMKSSCSATSERSLSLISKSFESTQKKMGASTASNWLVGHYQYANRLAHVQFLRDHGIDAHLVFVYFTGDTGMSGYVSTDDWTTAIKSAHLHLGFGTASLVPGVTDVRIDVDEFSRTQGMPGLISDERFPADYNYRERFTDLRELFGAEGGAVYTAQDSDRAILISDEGTLADFMDEEDQQSLIHIVTFELASIRAAYASIRYSQLAKPKL